ncbi:SpoIID/LytB domain-containing protein [Nocardia sp. XZ_19_369]|uniref:SpoIID/LytB domain-containing protein n=1 Tax=Nocardia sp. XZ_19_369 TaxID=2769487 RepID=UPI001E4D8798|nr:SpoIID/LytB domain-containing protein [Nocardia sp. XZ_19_369]
MSQHGAFANAQEGWTAEAILGHYYPGATLGTVPANTVGIRLTAQDDSTLDTYAAAGLRVAGRVVQAGQAAHLTPLPNGGANVVVTVGCEGEVLWQAGTNDPWVYPLDPGPNRPAAEHLTLCGGTGYRGALGVALENGAARTVNRVDVEDYLLGVLPAEVQANWADQGAAEALRAQAIAARSYVLAERRYSYAQSCDSTDCQVYPGTVKEDPRTAAAVAASAGTVLLRDGRILRSEYSSAPDGGEPADIYTFEVGPALSDLAPNAPRIPVDPRTRAAVAESPIDLEYRRIGGANSAVGQPLGPEMALPENAGTYRMFTNGVIISTPTLGAQVVDFTTLLQLVPDPATPAPGVPSARESGVGTPPVDKSAPAGSSTPPVHESAPAGGGVPPAPGDLSGPPVGEPAPAGVAPVDESAPAGLSVPPAHESAPVGVGEPAPVGLNVPPVREPGPTGAVPFDESAPTDVSAQPGRVPVLPSGSAPPAGKSGVANINSTPAKEFAPSWTNSPAAPDAAPSGVSAPLGNGPAPSGTSVLSRYEPVMSNANTPRQRESAPSGTSGYRLHESPPSNASALWRRESPPSDAHIAPVQDSVPAGVSAPSAHEPTLSNESVRRESAPSGTRIAPVQDSVPAGVSAPSAHGPAPSDVVVAPLYESAPSNESVPPVFESAPSSSGVPPVSAPSAGALPPAASASPGRTLAPTTAATPTPRPTPGMRIPTGNATSDRLVTASTEIVVAER